MTGETKVTIETTYSDGDNHETSVSINNGEVNIDDLFELFRRVAVGHGFSEKTFEDYLDS